MNAGNTVESLDPAEIPNTTFGHLDRLSDGRGLFEHAVGADHREGHGYCTDDNARLLVVTSRAPRDELAKHLSHLALNFVLDAFNDKGECRNRMDQTGHWADRPRVTESWGRSIWGLGSATSLHDDASVREMALNGFECAIQQRSPTPRAMAFAAIGASEVLLTHPGHAGARSLLADTLAVVPQIPAGRWAWPEPRLTSANATLAEAVIAAGAALQSDTDLRRGLAMLAWLLNHETRDGHLSVTGPAGRGPNDEGPSIDQRPVEVAAMADACWRAFELTGDPTWAMGIAMAVRWFNGHNDANLPMYDPASGGGFDCLERDRVNVNQSAEASISFISTMQRARSLSPVVAYP